MLLYYFGDEAIDYFRIAGSESGIAEYVLKDHLSADSQKKNEWILGDVITFEFTNNRFTRSKPYFAE